MHKVVAFYSGFIIHCESSLRALDRRELSDDAEHERWLFLFRLMMIVMNNWPGTCTTLHWTFLARRRTCASTSPPTWATMSLCESRWAEQDASWYNVKTNVMKMIESTGAIVFCVNIWLFLIYSFDMFFPRYNATLGHKVRSQSISCFISLQLRLRR